MNKLSQIMDLIRNLLPSSDGGIGKAYSLLNKIILTVLAVGIIVWYKFDYVATLLVNTQDIKTSVEKTLEEITGKKSVIEGDILFTTSPQPEIVVKKINIQNPEGSYKESFAQIDTLKTNPNLLNLVLGKVAFSRVYLENVIINNQSDNDAGVTNSAENNILISAIEGFKNKDIRLKNVEINNYKKNLKSEGYLNRKVFFADLEYTENQQGASGQVIKGAVVFPAVKENYIFLFDFKNGLLNDSEVSGRIYSDDSELALTGKSNLQNNLSFDLDVSGKIKNFSKKFFQLADISEKITDSMKEGEQATITGKITKTSNEIKISELSVVSDLIDFKMNQTTNISERIKNNIDIHISKFNYSSAFNTGSQKNIRKITGIDQDFQNRLNDFFLFSLGDDIDFDLNFNIDAINFSDLVGKLNLKAKYEDLKFTLEKFFITLPGKSGATAAAIIEADPAKKTMKGSAAFKFVGSNMDDLLTGLNLARAKKKKTLGEFVFEGKAYLYDKTIHLREFNGKIDDNLVAGQVLVDYSKEFAGQAAFNFNKLELGKFYIKDNAEEGFIDDSFAARLDIIRYFDSIFDHLSLSVNSDNLTNSGTKLDGFSIFAQISPGICEIKDFFFNTKLTGNVSGNAYFDITDFQPKAKFNIKMENLDFDLIDLGYTIVQNDTYNFDGKWSEDKISFEKLSSFDGEINLQADHLKFYHFNFDNFRVVMETSANKTKITEARLDGFGTKIDIDGQLTNDFPSFDLNFIATNIDIQSFMKDTFRFDNVSGQFNATGTISSSGISFKEMIKNLRGKFSIVSRGFAARGFDVAQLAKNLPKIKRIEQAEAAGKYFLNRGVTEFGGFSSYLQLSAGVMSFENLPLVNPVLRNTMATGKIDLNNWNMEITSVMGVISDDRMQVTVPLKNTSPKLPANSMEWDYNGIVKYWEDKFYSGQI